MQYFAHIGLKFFINYLPTVFNVNTMWYLHSYLICAKLFSFIQIVSLYLLNAVDNPLSF